MPNYKKTAKFSDHKLFWMTALSLLLSITTLIIFIFYVQLKTHQDRLVDETNMKFHMELGQLKACYEEGIKPCNIETLREFNQKTYGQ